MKKKPTPKPAATPLSRGKRALFISILICSPLVLLLGTEGVLRLCGYGGYPPLLRKVADVPGGKLVIADQAGAISYFFANRSRPGYNDQYDFIDPKPKGVFRIFIVGESAAKGYPQPRNLASSAFLEKMLKDAWPDRRVEIVNLGTTAVASFPVLGMLTEALEYEPDLVIIHTGHNEFFGAYGVNSISRGGTSIPSLKLTRLVRSLALVQAVSPGTNSASEQRGKSLMEIMAARSYTAPDDPIRTAAAGNLRANVSEMLDRCARRGVPAIVCSLPSNLRDLHPIGEDRVGLSGAERERFDAALERATGQLRSDPESAETNLTAAIALQPKNAHAHFLLGQVLFTLNRTNDALREFTAARDFDSMPWRATSSQNQALREAASKHGATLCDMEEAFRAESPGGCVGWELMDDHVHPTLRGQALMAEALVATLRKISGPAAIADAQFARIRPWQQYAAELGENDYDRFGVDSTMRLLFDVPFMRERNAAAFRRFDERVKAFEATQSAEMKKILLEWQSETPHAGAKRPITGMVARQLMRESRFEEALKYFNIARKSVPAYTSWHMEYVYFALVCREKLAGKLTEPERQTALEEINQGKVLLSRGFSQTGLTERYTGRLHQLRGEFAEAIPFLNASREKLTGFDLVAADEALFTSFLKTGRRDDARKLAEYGAANSGQYAGYYRQMLEILNQKRASTNGTQMPPQ